MATTRNEALEALAQRVADALPADVVEEVVLTGSVSRGMADEVSDIEMLVVPREPLELEECSALAGAAGLDRLDPWGAQGGPARRVSGYLDGEPLELIWWPRDFAEERIDALLAGVLTIVRPGERLSLLEWMFDGAVRVLTIVFALNRVWLPTTKRLAMRVAPLAVKPDRLAERIEEALTEPDPRRALLVMTELQLETCLLAPSGPNVDRARTWLAEAADVLR